MLQRQDFNTNVRRGNHTMMTTKEVNLFQEVLGKVMETFPHSWG